MKLPLPRGPLGEYVESMLRAPADETTRPAPDLQVSDGSIHDEDLQLSLWTLYELSYHGFADVDPRWEWHPEAVRLRGRLEAAFEPELRRLTRDRVAAVLEGDDLPTALFALTEDDDAPSIARYLHRHATREQTLEFLVHRSIYHLKESDPLSFQIARLSGAPKVALMELQYDEYGAGRHEALHSRLFAETLQASGLDHRYGAYVDRVPAVTLAVNNAMSMFGLHRRLRGAAVGHLGAFEATSSLPCRRIAEGMRRLGFSERAVHYFDEHIEADAVHEQLAFRDICGGLVKQHPELHEDIAFGAAVCLALEGLSARYMLGRWEADESSLSDGAGAGART